MDRTAGVALRRIVSHALRTANARPHTVPATRYACRLSKRHLGYLTGVKTPTVLYVLPGCLSDGGLSLDGWALLARLGFSLRSTTNFGLPNCLELILPDLILLCIRIHVHEHDLFVLTPQPRQGRGHRPFQLRQGRGHWQSEHRAAPPLGRRVNDHQDAPARRPIKRSSQRRRHGICWRIVDRKVVQTELAQLRWAM